MKLPSFSFRWQVLLAASIFSLQLAAQMPGFPGGGGRPPQGPSITGRIQGIVLDSLGRRAVEFATVVLTDASGSRQVDGTVTEADGSFKLINVKTGTYKLTVSYLGYSEKSFPITTSPDKPDKDLGTVLLSAEGINLEQVTVTGEAALVENRIDKLVYNAEKDVSNAGGDAADVLRRVPLLTVDLEGNVSLRGSSNILVLVNGRPSTIFASSIADALKTIPADQIKSVEVITSPSAKYDGEGSGGIINIITKKKSAEGVTGSMNTSVGTRQNNSTFNINSLKGRFGLNGSANAFWSWRREGELETLREDYSTTPATIFRQDGLNASQVLGYNGSVGAFYDFNAYHAVNGSVRFNGFNNYRDGAISGTLGQLGAAPSISFDRQNENDGLRNGFDAVLDYRRTFPNSEREFTAAAQLSGTYSNSLNEVFQDGTTLFYQQDVLNENDGINLEYIGQLDYVHPFSAAVKLETGVKTILRRIDSDYQTSLRSTDGGSFVPVSQLTDLFRYNQDVLAGYVSFNLKPTKNFGILAGVRYERTAISGDYESDQPAFTQAYDNFLPSLTLNRTFKQFQTLKLSYNRRIQRPSLFYVNPFTQINDPNNVSVGNPYLDPELVDQVELSYNAFVKGIALNAGVYYRESNNLIENFLQINPVTQIGETRFLNIARDRSLGFNGFASVTLKQVFTLRAGINIFSYNASSIIDTLDLSRSTLIWNGNASINWKLPKGWQAETFAFFSSPRQSLQGINPSFWLINFGVRKDFNEQWSLGIRAIDPFFRRKRFPSELQGETFYQRTVFSIPFQSYGINLVYKFGKMQFNPASRGRRNKLDNSDLKGSGDSNF